MSLNYCVLNGKLPHFDGTYKKGDGENSKSYLFWAISVKRDFKKKDEQYFPEDLIPFRAFGQKADFIMDQFQKGSGVILDGRIEIGDDYQKDGQTIKGQPFLNVANVHFPEASKKEENASNSNSPKSKPSKSASANRGVPPLPKSPKLPGKPGSLPKPPVNRAF